MTASDALRPTGPSGKPTPSQERAQLLARERAARAAAEAAEARYRGLFEGIPDPLLVTDDEGHYLDANQALADLLGYTRRELAQRRGGLAAMGARWRRTQFARLRREASGGASWSCGARMARRFRSKPG
jgi:PAS domain-containing protein